MLAEVGTPEEWRGWAWPSALQVGWFKDEVEYLVEGRMTPQGPRIERIELTGISIDTSHLREPIVSRFRAGFAQAMTSSVDGTRRVSLHPGRTPNPAAAINRLHEVAHAYLTAAPRHRQRAVAEAMGVSQGYARKLVMAARRAGLIGRRAG